MSLVVSLGTFLENVVFKKIWLAVISWHIAILCLYFKFFILQKAEFESSKISQNWDCKLSLLYDDLLVNDSHMKLLIQYNW